MVAAQSPHASNLPPLNASGRTSPVIRILGPPDVLGAPGTIEKGKISQLTELLAYIALKPGAKPAQLRRDLWPGCSRATLDTAISKARTYLTVDGDRYRHLPMPTDGTGYHLQDIQLDWHIFRDLSRRGNTTRGLDGIGHFEAALAHLRGVPFESQPNRYSWAIHDIAIIHTAIADTAIGLAARYTNAGEPEAAIHAITTAIRATDPVPDRLWNAYRTIHGSEGDTGNHTARPRP